MASKKTPNPTDKHVGTRIRMRRLMLDMSQTDLGNAVNLTFQQIQKYEKGSNRVGASRLQQFANFMKVPVAFFFEGQPGGKSFGDDSPNSPAYVQQFLATGDGLAFVKAYMKIRNAALRRSLVQLTEKIADEQE